MRPIPILRKIMNSIGCMDLMLDREGSSHDRGLYARCFEEFFDFVNSDATATSRYDFSVTVFELHNEQVRDLVHESGRNSSKICMGSSDFFVELTQEKVDNPLDFLKVLKDTFQSRGNDVLKFNISHLYQVHYRKELQTCHLGQVTTMSGVLWMLFLRH
ncbi:hypothetical protein EUGRSUZ_J00029 [Eucalyptus grandis]|uniref:Uncharacterized protein n=2 Tax=Eucalyptus grandis TaxID=71139 RepID=A0ACC3J091_EUCGR|nr:hypothetical protein EUGRSUZ_J00029 [Eucalyptus grandis]